MGNIRLIFGIWLTYDLHMTFIWLTLSVDIKSIYVRYYFHLNSMWILYEFDSRTTSHRIHIEFTSSSHRIHYGGIAEEKRRKSGVTSKKEWCWRHVMARVIQSQRKYVYCMVWLPKIKKTLILGNFLLIITFM